MMIKNLSVNVCKKNPNFTRVEDDDYRHDWGGYERGYAYKGLRISTCRHDGMTYLDIDPIFIGQSFTRKEFRDAGGRELTNKFSGVETFDLDDLIDTCEAVIALIDELEERTKDDEPDMADVKARIQYEIALADRTFSKVYAMKWWNLSKWDVGEVLSDMEWLKGKKQELLDMDVDNLSREKKQELVESVSEYGHVLFNETYWAVDGINKAFVNAED